MNKFDESGKAKLSHLSCSQLIMPWKQDAEASRFKEKSESISTVLTGVFVFHADNNGSEGTKVASSSQIFSLAQSRLRINGGLYLR